jgi:hypothetical protein
MDRWRLSLNGAFGVHLFWVMTTRRDSDTAWLYSQAGSRAALRILCRQREAS